MIPSTAKTPTKHAEFDKDLLLRIENMIRSFQKIVKDAEGQENEEALVYGLRAIVYLASMILHKRDIFDIEPWHVISAHAPLACPGEMLLRLKDYKGRPMPPYPAIMAFYNHGYTAEIDCILFLAALDQFIRNDEKQVSINISARSLRDPDFVKTTLERLEHTPLAPDEKIIIEIHESTPHLSLSKKVLALYKNLGISFAIDDVGLNMNDVMRLAEFEGLAEFVKIDRHVICSPKEQDPSPLQRVTSLVSTLMPGAVMIAEGIQNTQHALEIKQQHPSILYAQGLYLPKDRKTFALDFHNLGINKQAD
ncbi:MAG: EAL domain-containing protein [Alphaproteobacteria bacterium]|nr:EAL domain-containing protein [Alphaproteobacteria bacterium]